MQPTQATRRKDKSGAYSSVRCVAKYHQVYYADEDGD